jgi:hypothetical protein
VALQYDNADMMTRRGLPQSQWTTKVVGVIRNDSEPCILPTGQPGLVSILSSEDSYRPLEKIYQKVLIRKHTLVFSLQAVLHDFQVNLFAMPTRMS